MFQSFQSVSECQSLQRPLFSLGFAFSLPSSFLSAVLSPKLSSLSFLHLMDVFINFDIYICVFLHFFLKQYERKHHHRYGGGGEKQHHHPRKRGEEK